MGTHVFFRQHDALVAEQPQRLVAMLGRVPRVAVPRFSVAFRAEDGLDTGFAVVAGHGRTTPTQVGVELGKETAKVFGWKEEPERVPSGGEGANHHSFNCSRQHGWFRPVRGSFRAQGSPCQVEQVSMSRIESGKSPLICLRGASRYHDLIGPPWRKESLRCSPRALHLGYSPTSRWSHLLTHLGRGEQHGGPSGLRGGAFQRFAGLYFDAWVWPGVGPC